MFTKLIIFLLAVNVVYVSMGVLRYPLHSVDVYAIWLLKAKAIYLNLGQKTLTNPNYLISHPEYPLLLPFVFSQIYKLFGGINEYLILGLYPFIYLSILILAYKCLRLSGHSQHTSLLLTYIYSMLSPLLAQAGRNHAGNADIVLTLVMWGLVYMQITKKPVWQMAFLVIVASQIKLEGALFSLLLPLRSIWFALSLVPALAWLYLRPRLGLPLYYGFFIPPDLLTRIFQLVTAAVGELLNFRNWYVFWPLFFLGLTYAKSKYLKPLSLIMLCYVPIYLFSNYPQGIVNHVGSSLDRLLLQVSPLLLLIFAKEYDVHR